MNIEIKLVKVAEFQEMLNKHILHNWKDYSKEHVLEYLMTYGFPKFEAKCDDLKKFMNQLNGMIFMETVAIDFGDSMFYWVVCGTDAMLVHKGQVKTTEA